MKKAFASLGTLALTAALACSSDPVPVAPQGDLAVAPASLDRAALAASPGTLPVPAVGLATTLTRDVPLAQDLTTSKVIGPTGGELDLPAAGLHVFVPRGAVPHTTTITATALKGDMVAYEFGPHGTRFNLPLVVTQRTQGTSADALPAGTVLQLAYFTDPDALDPVKKQARVAELTARLALVTDDAVVYPVWHFSGYTIVFGFHVDDGNGNGNGNGR